MSGGDDWQPGDLALCVNGEENPFWPGWAPKPGRVYTVAAVTGLNTNHRALLSPGLLLREMNSPAPYASHRFRKIRPHVPDEEDAETIRLLTGETVREPVA